MNAHSESESDACPVTLATIREAAERLRPWARRTPVLTSRLLDRWIGARVFLKCESFQRVGAFKFRGAMNAILRLSEPERRRGVVTHSSGNHAQALALAGALAKVPVTVVMPTNAPAVKRAATEGYGARIVPCAPTQADREATVERLIAERGHVLIHPYDDWRIIAGAGTAALELIEEAGPLDALLAPVGGGGLMSGSCLAAEGLDPRIRRIGAEPAGADDARRSLETGQMQPSIEPRTVADGLRTSLCGKTFGVLRRSLERIVTVEDGATIEATRFLWERLKIVVEPSAAVPIAALANRSIPDLEDRRVGVILSGGNLDLEPFFQPLNERWATR